MNVVPKLTDLLSDHAKAALVPSEAIPSMLAELERLKAMLWSRLTVPSGNGQPCSQDADRLLGVKEAAARLGLSPDTLYRRHKHDQNYRDLTVNNGTRKVLFSERKIEAFLRRRTGR